MANKIAIAGAGAMGSRIGTYLKQSGQDVTLIDYWKDHVPVSYTHLTLPTTLSTCRSRWSPYH